MTTKSSWSPRCREMHLTQQDFYRHNWRNRKKKETLITERSHSERNEKHCIILAKVLFLRFICDHEMRSNLWIEFMVRAEVIDSMKSPENSLLLTFACINQQKVKVPMPMSLNMNGRKACKWVNWAWDNISKFKRVAFKF